MLQSIRDVLVSEGGKAHGQMHPGTWDIPGIWRTYSCGYRDPAHSRVAEAAAVHAEQHANIDGPRS